GEDPRDEEVVVRNPTAGRDVRSLVDAREDREEHQREYEREDPASTVAPVSALLVSDLPQDQAEIALHRRCQHRTHRSASCSPIGSFSPGPEPEPGPWPEPQPVSSR